MNLLGETLGKSRLKSFRSAHCNVHNLRELRFIVEQYGHPWAEDMACSLLDIKAEVEAGQPGELTHIARFQVTDRPYGSMIDQCQ
jgi:hypothetical protein